ncbi:MAG: hypothetical protein ABI569_14705 [Casimicrobiaceae bacterium]
MLMCPVDLEACERAGCRGGTCEMAGMSPLLLCWECGAVEGRAHGAEVCVVCLHAFRPAPVTEGA